MTIHSIKRIIRTIINDLHYSQKAKLLISSCQDRTSKLIVRDIIIFYSDFLEKYQAKIPFCQSPLIRFQKRIIKHTKPYYLTEELNIFNGKKIVLFGSGDNYQYTQNILINSNWKNKYRLMGHNLNDLKSFDIKNEILIPTNVDEIDYIVETVKQLYPQITVFIPTLKFIWTLTGKQYFDVFTPNNNEVVIDCGAFDGQTELDFLKWGGSKIKKIYAFELDPINRKKCEQFYKDNQMQDLVTLIGKGTSNKNATIFIDSNGEGTPGSRIGNGNIEAKVVRIDDEIKEPISFIKMDIEGAELNSLMGAKETIKKNKPRLAICIYHKKDDIVEIPTFLLSIVPEYRFHVRHYSSNQWETVLFASVH